MPVQRLATTTIFLCIGILLLSACGLPLGPSPRARPAVVHGDFFLYTVGPHPQAIATGSVDGTTNLRDIPGQLTWLAPDCLKGQHVVLTGELSATLALHAIASQPPLTLAASTAPTYRPTAIEVLPFTGTLTRTGSCADVSQLTVETRLVPILTSSWRGSAQDATGKPFAITMTLYRHATSPGVDNLRGSIRISSPNHPVGGLLKTMQVTSSPGPLTLVFGGEPTITVFLPNLGLSDNPHTLDTRITIQEGAATGQVFHAILSSAYPEE